VCNFPPQNAVFVRDHVLLRGLGIGEKKDISSIFLMCKGSITRCVFDVGQKSQQRTRRAGGLGRICKIFVAHQCRMPLRQTVRRTWKRTSKTHHVIDPLRTGVQFLLANSSTFRLISMDSWPKKILIAQKIIIRFKKKKKNSRNVLLFCIFFTNFFSFSLQFRLSSSCCQLCSSNNWY
jgi:hypothetical protein